MIEKIKKCIECLNEYNVFKHIKRIYAYILYIYNMARKATKTNQQWTRYEANHKYEITCTFTDEWQGLKSTRCQNELQRLIHFNKFIQCTYQPLLKHCSYELYTEISDPQVIDGHGKIPRLHLHGTITLGDWEDVLKFKLNTLPNIGGYGRIQINQYRPEWEDYITKDQDVYSRWLKKYTSMDILISQTEHKNEGPTQEDVDNFFKCG